MNKALTRKRLGIIRGRAECGAYSAEMLTAVLDYVDLLEEMLDDGDQMDAFGTEGWRHRAGNDE